MYFRVEVINESTVDWDHECMYVPNIVFILLLVRQE